MIKFLSYMFQMAGPVPVWQQREVTLTTSAFQKQDITRQHGVFEGVIPTFQWL